MRSRFSTVLLFFAICALVERGVANTGPPPHIHPSWESRYHALSMPAPIYPYEARKQHLTVDGVIAVDIDTRTGLVTAATMKKSTGSAILDEASLSVTKKWRFQPGGAFHLDVPVSFGIEGGRLG